MFVVFEVESGYSDESMRFQDASEVREYLDDNPGTDYAVRVETD